MLESVGTKVQHDIYGEGTIVGQLKRPVRYQIRWTETDLITLLSPQNTKLHIVR